MQARDHHKCNDQRPRQGRAGAYPAGKWSLHGDPDEHEAQDAEPIEPEKGWRTTVQTCECRYQQPQRQMDIRSAMGPPGELKKRITLMNL